MIMSTEYIVKFSKNIGNYLSDSTEIDGFLELTAPNNFSRVPTISVRTCKESTHKDNVSLLFKFITSNFAEVNFDDKTHTCSMTYKDGYSRSLDYKSDIKFDSSSSSAYSKFKSEFEKLLNSKQETQYYDSGRVKYVGDIQTKDDDSFYQGEGVIYYDSYHSRPQYIGEFEENVFDGSGKFYNYDNNIILEANNISNGIPVQKGTLHINFKHRQEVIKVDFDELWFNIGLKEKSDRREFVKSTNFVNVIASSYLDKTDKKMQQLIFEDRSSPEQSVAIWTDLQHIKEELDIMKKDTNINMNNMVTVARVLTSVMVFSILLNISALFFSR